MKLLISFDITDLDKALTIARDVAEFADGLEVGSLLLYKYGINAVDHFRKAFPEKTLYVDTKIVDVAKESVALISQTGADWMTVMAGTSKSVIHSAGKTAHTSKTKILLDLLDASSLGQSALEAQSNEVDALLLHRPHDEEKALIFLDQWEMVRGNTSLPIYVAGKITREMLEKVIAIKPDGIIVGKVITDAENPAEEAKYFRDLIQNEGKSPETSPSEETEK